MAEEVRADSYSADDARFEQLIGKVIRANAALQRHADAHTQRLRARIRDLEEENAALRRQMARVFSYCRDMLLDELPESVGTVVLDWARQQEAPHA